MCGCPLYINGAGMKACLPKVFETYKTMLPTSSINCIVAAMLGLCLGLSVGFTMAAWRTAEGIKRLGNAGMSRALGLPALFIWDFIPRFYGVLPYLTIGYGQPILKYNFAMPFYFYGFM